jgi:ubiquitin-protein ligase
MGIRETRLVQERTRMEELCRQSGFITFEAKPEPPDEYVVTFTCRGLVDVDEVGEEHVAEIYLPAEFPFEPPQVRFLTPSFHPNIAAQIQMERVQEQIEELLRLAPDDASRQRIQEDIRNDKELFKARVCLDTLNYNWSPSITLDRICIELGEMIQYKRYNPAHPLNQQAAFWAEVNRRRLPIDARSLLDLRALAGIRILAETEIGQGDFDIQILDEGNPRG